MRKIKLNNAHNFCVLAISKRYKAVSVGDKLLPFLNIKILPVSELIYLWAEKTKFGISSVWPTRKTIFSALRGGLPNNEYYAGHPC